MPVSLPPDVVLPANAKYYSFIESKHAYNPDHDITWSFQFAVSSYNAATQFAFSTFLLPVSSLLQANLSSVPGHYVGVPFDEIYLAAESGDVIITESSEPILVYSNLSGAFCTITFDSTGLFALSGEVYFDIPGVSRSRVIPNSLIIRDYDYNVVTYSAVSALNTSFLMLTTSKVYQTLRFRYANSGRKLSVDFRPDTSTEFITLTSVIVNKNYNLPEKAYIGFSFTTPVSTTLTRVADMYLKNFHIDGNSTSTTIETLTRPSLTATKYQNYSLLTGVTALPPNE